MKRKGLVLLLTVVMICFVIPTVTQNASASYITDQWQWIDGVKQERCTYRAWHEANARLGVSLPDNWGNGGSWAANARAAGYTVDKTPSADSIVCWSGGEYGHVAYVTGVDDTNIYIVEAGINPSSSYPNYWYRETSFKVSNQNRWSGFSLEGYIHLAPPDPPPAPGKPSVSVNRPNVTVSWNDVEREDGYDVYLIQAPYAWADVKYHQNVGANTTSCTFSGVADGNYAAFVISRPNSDDVQSQWAYFIVSVAIPEGTYYIRSALNNDLVVSVANESMDWNANVQLETFKGTKAQQFRIEAYNGKYTLRNVNSNLAVDVKDRSSANEANVQQYNFWPWETSGQQWTFESAGDGLFYIHSALGTYLDVPGGVATNGMNIQMYTGNGTASQKFKLELLPPTISMGNNVFQTGDSAIVEFGNWNGATAFGYYLAEFPEDFAYTTNTRHEDVAWTSKSFTDLPAGHYSLFAHAVNDYSVSGQSNWVTFDVYDKDYIPVARRVYNGHIYAVYDYETSWTFARNLCKDLGGHLVTINDRSENWFITNLILSGEKNAYWIGASNYSSSAANQDGAWSWVTGELFSFTNWREGEPSASGNEGTREHWAEIRKSYSSQWNDVNNTNKSNKGFIIEIEPSDADITARARYNGSEYLLIDKNTTWSEAIEYCDLLGGRLFYPDDAEEEAFVDSLLEQGTRSWYYMGADRYDGAWHRLYDGSVIPTSDIDWSGSLWPDHCNYLMKFKDNKKYINLPNAYYPEKDISKIGFICEIPNAYEEVSIQATDSNGVFTITTTGATSGKVILALYDSDGRMVESHAESCTGADVTFTAEHEYASAKAMLLDASFRPLCGAWESQ